MTTKVHSIHFDADSKLLEFIDEKVSKLVQYHDNIVESEIFLRLENSGTQDNKIVEIKISVPGDVLFAKEKCKTFEEATDLVVDSVRRQLKRKKEKARGL